MSNLPVELPATTQVLRIDANMPDFKDILYQTLSLVNITDIICQINPKVEYVVQVPLKYQKALASGALKMMQNKENGTMWATVVRVLESGRNEIVCNCPIKEELRHLEEPMQDLSFSYQTLFFQQKLAEISAQIQDVREVVGRIEQGQASDRFAKVISGRDDIERALMNKDVNARKRELEIARSKISEAQTQIGFNLKERIESFQRIPSNPLVRWAKDWGKFGSDFQIQQDMEFHKIEGIFGEYVCATNLLAASFVLEGENDRAKDVYDRAGTFINSINYSNIKTVDYMFGQSAMDKAFYNRAGAIIGYDKTKCLNKARPLDCIEIVVDGEDLKGVLENGI